MYLLPVATLVANDDWMFLCTGVYVSLNTTEYQRGDVLCGDILHVPSVSLITCRCSENSSKAYPYDLAHSHKLAELESQVPGSSLTPHHNIIETCVTGDHYQSVEAQGLSIKAVVEYQADCKTTISS